MVTAPGLNVDDNEIEKFSKIASRWWDPEGEFKPLHKINPIRNEYINDHIGGAFGKAILDVGCGGGILAESLAQQSAHVTGIDMAQESLDVASLHALETGCKVTYQCETAEQHAQSNKAHYDVVTCMEMLEHVPDPASIVSACAKLVKPGGDVFFSTLNRNIKSYLLAIFAAENVLGWVPKGTHEYEKFIKPSELMKWIDASPLKVKHITGLHFNGSHFYLSNSNVDVNYIIHCKHIG